MFGRTCLSVCLSVCLFICNTITFESLDVDRSFLVSKYIFSGWVKFLYAGRRVKVKVTQEERKALVGGLPSIDRQSCWYLEAA